MQVEEAIARSLRDQEDRQQGELHERDSATSSLLMPDLSYKSASSQAGTSGTLLSAQAEPSNSTSRSGIRSGSRGSQPGASAGGRDSHSMRSSGQGHGGMQAGTVGRQGDVTGVRALAAKRVQERRRQQQQQAAASDGVDWEAVVAQARARGDDDCPVCLGALNRRGDEGESG